MTDIDATLEQQIFDVPQRERIPNIQHHDHADDFGRCMKVAKRILKLVHPLRLASEQTVGHLYDSAIQSEDAVDTPPLTAPIAI